MGAEACCQWHQAGRGSVSRAAHTGDHCVPRENLFLTLIRTDYLGACICDVKGNIRDKTLYESSRKTIKIRPS